jgi:hypothetical protein
MSISKDEAAQALGEVAAARSRVWQIKAYGYTSPFLIVWGAVWMAADLILQAEPGWALTWPTAVAVGALASLAVGFTLPRAASTDGGRRLDWRNFAVWGLVMGFIASLFFVLPPMGGRSQHSLFALLFGFIYLGMGLWMGWRLSALGAALVALTFIGFYAVGHWYLAFMGLVSGGALVLGGLWLRKI